MNNKTLILLIVIIAAVTVLIVSWRTPTQNTGELTPTPTMTVTATPTPTDPFAVTPTVTITTTPTVTVTPTPTVTTTPTPTPTATTGTFNDIRDEDWVYGMTEQTVGTSIYFIDEDEPKKIKKGTSKADTGAQTVFTSDTNGEVGSFYVNGGNLYVVTKRDPSTNYSKFQKVALSSGAKAKLYEFYSGKYEATQFAVMKNNDTKTGFYIGLEGVNNNYEPAGMYITNYTQQWILAFVGVDKTAEIIGIAPTEDGTQLAGLFEAGGDQEQAYIDLE